METNARWKLIGLAPAGCQGCGILGVGFLVVLFVPIQTPRGPAMGLTAGLIWKHP